MYILVYVFIYHVTFVNYPHNLQQIDWIFTQPLNCIVHIDCDMLNVLIWVI